MREDCVDRVALVVVVVLHVHTFYVCNVYLLYNSMYVLMLLLMCSTSGGSIRIRCRLVQLRVTSFCTLPYPY